jgi:hypothetical protein
MPGANWKDLTPQEKADWFDNSIRKWEELTKRQKEQAAKEIRQARSKARFGAKRHKKRRWWNH